MKTGVLSINDSAIEFQRSHFHESATGTRCFVRDGFLWLDYIPAQKKINVCTVMTTVRKPGDELLDVTRNVRWDKPDGVIENVEKCVIIESS